MSWQGNDIDYLTILDQALRCADGSAGNWSIDSDTNERSGWISVSNGGQQSPEQGWKIHVSASIRSAEEVLRRCLPILFDERVSFKFAACPDDLDDLNEGNGGLSQIGKFITAYPYNDDQSVRLAVRLDDATRGLEGPAIPSDRPLNSDSLVHYRYGSFGGRHLQTPLGLIQPAILGPAGELIPDVRATAYEPPSWVSDPFELAGVAAKYDSRPQLIGDRYLIVSTFNETARGAIYLAADIVARRGCVLKEARRWSACDAMGRDARDRLRHEHETLTRLASVPGIPEVYDLVEFDNRLYLVIEDIDGPTLEEYVSNLSQEGRLPTAETLIVQGRELASVLARIHANGFVYRDLKSANVIVAESGIRLVDFDITYDRRKEVPVYGRGTPGYMSPQQSRGETPTPADDVYALGAVLYFLATGAEPSQAPRPSDLLDRPVHLLNPTVPAAVIDIIAKCLEPELRNRFKSVEEIDAALAAGRRHARARSIRILVPGSDQAESDARRHSLALAYRLGNSLCKTSKPIDDERLTWASAHDVGSGSLTCDVNTGASGTVLALAELAVTSGDADLRAVLKRAANHLVTIPKRTLPGLYIGDAGVGAALLRAGQVLEDKNFVEASVDRACWIDTLPYQSPDLFHGVAGRLRFNLLLWDETNDHGRLEAAIRAGEFLIGSTVLTSDGLPTWVIPEGYDGLSGERNLGYAHGVAGIADALLDLYEATGSSAYLDCAVAAGRLLDRTAAPALEDGSGATWPVNEGEGPCAAFWCHGAAGIGRFLIRLSKFDALTSAPDLATRAARAVAGGTRWANPTQCHGLAGNIEFLLDMYQARRDETFLADARVLALILDKWAAERDGLLLWPSESPTVYTPDYMVGYAGLIPCFLRLAAPERQPHQLSRSGFRQDAFIGSSLGAGPGFFG